MREWNEKKLTETVLISGFGRKIHIRANDSEKKNQNEKNSNHIEMHRK